MKLLHMCNFKSLGVFHSNSDNVHSTAEEIKTQSHEKCGPQSHTYIKR